PRAAPSRPGPAAPARRCAAFSAAARGGRDVRRRPRRAGGGPAGLHGRHRAPQPRRPPRVVPAQGPPRGGRDPRGGRRPGDRGGDRYHRTRPAPPRDDRLLVLRRRPPGAQGRPPLPPRGHGRRADHRERPRPRGGGRRVGQPRRGRLPARLPERAARRRHREGRAGRPRMNISWTTSGAGPRALTLLVLALLACLLPVATLPAAATTADPEEAGDPDEVTVELTDIRPAILTPDDDLVVRGTVTNGSDATLELPEVRLRSQQSAPISRSLLERWLEPTSLSATTLLTAERLPDPLEPGASVS